MPPRSFPTLSRLASGSHAKRPGAPPIVVALLLALLGCALLAAPVSAAATADRAGKVGKKQPEKKRHPKPKPMYWGAWIGEQFTGTDAPWDMNAVARFQAVVGGKGLSLLEFSSPFEDCAKLPCHFYRFPTIAMNNVRAYGAIPVFSWGAEANPRVSVEQPDFQLADIAGGAYDAEIAQFAAEARDWGHPFFLRFNWEMNGNWFPWSEKANGNAPGQYVAAWRRVHDIFGAVGAHNATWVWCPYADTPQRLKQTPLKPLYPGHGYVDWTCLDGYNWGRNPVNPRPWRSFDEIFAPAYKAVTKKIAPRKPLMLAEFATSPYGGHKALWIRKMFEKLPRKYPRVRALIYFDSVDRGVDWPLETSPRAARAFAKGVRKGRYANNRFAEIATSPIPPLR
ncbi:MAG TPA: glycosyl hydrolase [Solirubrobacterales bacterium]|nr:glycosyl hydrolase [Solirubrobacterales bacterium]